MDVTVAIPVKPFSDAKRRLAAVLGDDARRDLAIALARRTVDVVVQTDAAPLVLSADAEVTEWANTHGLDVALDEGSSLDEAATAAVTRIRATGGAWSVLHADLPSLAAADLTDAVARLAAGGAVLAPSSDGGTSLIGAAIDGFVFRHGPGSFHRHLAALAPLDPLVVVRTGLLLDLDEPDDLTAASRRAEGAWLSG